jgi:hypothetical protein
LKQRREREEKKLRRKKIQPSILEYRHVSKKNKMVVVSWQSSEKCRKLLRFMLMKIAKLHVFQIKTHEINIMRVSLEVQAAAFSFVHNIII